MSKSILPYRKKHHKPGFEYRFLVVYLVVGIIWILASDTLVDQFTGYPGQLMIQTLKGWFFVIVTGFFFFWMIKREVAERKKVERELEAQHSTLEELVEKRSKQIKQAHDKLRASYEQIQASNKQLKHEIKTKQEAQQALEESEEKFYAFMQQSADGMLLIDQKGQIIDSNQAICKMFAVSAQEINGMFIWDFEYRFIPSHKRDKTNYQYNKIQAITKNYLNHLSEQKSLRLEGEMEIESGVFRYLQVSVFPIITSKGQFVGRITRDITESKQAQKELETYKKHLEDLVLERTQALLESEEQFNEALDAVTDGVWNWTIPTGEGYFSPRYYTMLGYQPDEFLPSFASFESLLHPEDRKRVLPLIYEYTQKKGDVFEVEFRLHTKDHQWRWIMSRGKTVAWTDEGKPLRMVGTHVDINRRKHAETALMLSESRYRLLFENAGLLIFSYDVNGKLLLMNNITASYLGGEPKDFIGRYANDFLSDIVAERVMKRVKSVLDQDRLVEFEHQDLSWKNKNIWLLTIAHPIYDEQQQAMSVQFVSKDITSRKQAERELDHYKKQLETLVKERTEEIEQINEELLSANEELQMANIELREQQLLLEKKSRKMDAGNQILRKQTEKLAQALQKLQQAQTRLVQSEKMVSLGILTAGIAHEINNPINFIAANVSGLERATNDLKEILIAYDQMAELLPEDLQQSIERIKAELDYEEAMIDLDTLINNIKTGVKRVSEIINSLRSFSRAEESEKEAVDIHSCIEATLTMLQHQFKHRIEVVKHYKAKHKIMAYPGRLNQVFMNLLANANQAIKQQGTITISTWETADNTLAISIEDTGCGIQIPHLKKIFEPFFTTKPVGTGTGMGLAITYSIIEQHKGRIDVDSKVGKGTIFYIYLPITP